MEYPGLNLSDLTDSEIYDKISELHRKLVYAHFSAGNGVMVAQLQALLETLQFEQTERAMKKQMANQVSSVVRETDPEPTVRPAKTASRKDKTATGKTSSHPVFVPKRTARPTSGDQ